MTKLSLTILVAALLVSVPALGSGSYYPGAEHASVHQLTAGVGPLYQERLTREVYIKRQIEGRRTQSTFNPSGLRVGDVILDGFGQRSTPASVSPSEQYEIRKIIKKDADTPTNRSRGPAKVREQSQSPLRRPYKKPARRHYG